jgi:type I restriction enzyme S subunit
MTTRHLVRLGDVAERIQTGPFGSLLHKEDYAVNGIPLVNPMHIAGGKIRADPRHAVTRQTWTRLAAYRLHSGDVVLGRRGEMGRCAVVRDDADGYLCGTGSLFIRSDPNELHPAYLSRLLSSPGVVAQLERASLGTTMANLNQGIVADLRFPLPPVAEQVRLAAIIDRADALRVRRREALGYLDDLTQSIFLDMFGDPTVNPRGWPTSTLSAIVSKRDQINYGVVQPGDSHPDGVGLVRVGDLARGRIQKGRLKRIDPLIEKAYSRSRLRGNEVLISCVGSIGVVAIADEDDAGLNIARAISRIPIDSAPLRYYVAAFLQTAAAQRYFTRELRTVAQPTLNIKQLGETRLPIPRMDLLEDFCTRTHVVQRVVASCRNQLEEIDAIFASLQERAFSGEL